MFLINEIRGEGNAYQQDRTGKLEKTTADGTRVQLMWAIDGHGTRISYSKYDLGGTVAQTAHDILKVLGADAIKQLYDDTAFGKKLYAEIQVKIEQVKDDFLISRGWKKLVDAEGSDVNVLWSKPGRSVITSSGGTTLILVACVNESEVWKARMYNVGDSMMIHGDTVYSQSGIDGISDDTVRAMTESEITTCYCAIPGKIGSKKHSMHTVSSDGIVSMNAPPSPVRRQQRYYISNVRGDIATGISLTYVPKMFNLTEDEPQPRRYSFSINTNLASWSNMGDTQNASWASVPSYSEPFTIEGPLSLISDGIGDILKSEEPATLEEKMGWFNYYTDHPMSSADASKNCIFKNAWFHETIMSINEEDMGAVHDDPFYKVAKATFGVADNICRITFIPPQ